MTACARCGKTMKRLSTCAMCNRRVCRQCSRTVGKILKAPKCMDCDIPVERSIQEIEPKPTPSAAD